MEKKIKGFYETYTINDAGEVIIKPRMKANGYGMTLEKVIQPIVVPRTGRLYYRLSINEKPDIVMADKLIFETFVRHLKDGEYIHHIDGNPANIALNNLVVLSDKIIIKLLDETGFAKRQRCGE